MNARPPAVVVLVLVCGALGALMAWLTARSAHLLLPGVLPEDYLLGSWAATLSTAVFTILCLVIACTLWRNARPVQPLGSRTLVRK